MDPEWGDREQPDPKDEWVPANGCTSAYYDAVDLAAHAGGIPTPAWSCVGNHPVGGAHATIALVAYGGKPITWTDAQAAPEGANR